MTLQPNVPAWFPNAAADLSRANEARGGLAVRVTAPEFTWIHPETVVRRFGVLVIDYEPTERALEQDTFAIYAAEFQDRCAHAEDLAVEIGNDLVRRLAPKWITVEVQASPRNGITFWPRFEYNAERDGAWDPE